MKILDKIQMYGNPDANYKPFAGAVFYPLMSHEFIRTGFMEICPTLSARDYKDPKRVIEVTYEKGNRSKPWQEPK